MRNIAYSKSAPDRAGPWVNPIRQLERDVKARTFPIRVPAQPCRFHSSRATRQRQLRPPRFRIRARGPRGRSRTPIWLVATLPPSPCPSRFQIPLLASKDAVATDPDADRRAVRTVWVRPVGTEMYSEKFYTPDRCRDR